MLSWVTNSPDLTDVVCDDFRRWATERYGKEALARSALRTTRAWPPRCGARPRAGPSRSTTTSAATCATATAGTWRSCASRPSGTASPACPSSSTCTAPSGGRGRTFPIGISQLFESYRGQPQMTSGSDYYLGDLTVENAPDLYVANAFLAAVHDADQPLTSLEFEAGNGDYGEDLSKLYPPEAVDLKTRMCVAQGNRLLNLYLFAGGYNPPLATPVGDGNDRIAFTGERHGFAAPVNPEGRLNPTYGAAQRAFAAVRGAARLLADSDEEDDGFALAFVPDHYLTEYHHPASARAPRRWRTSNACAAWDPATCWPARCCWPDTRSRRSTCSPRRQPCRRRSCWPARRRCGATCRSGWPRTCATAAGCSSTASLPERDFDGTPCTVLADALGLRVAGGVARHAALLPVGRRARPRRGPGGLRPVPHRRFAVADDGGVERGVRRRGRRAARAGPW